VVYGHGSSTPQQHRTPEATNRNTTTLSSEIEQAIFEVSFPLCQVRLKGIAS